MQTKRPTPKDFRPDIEGLRGFTLLAILGFHAEVPGVGGGFVGPDVFFIISGFVITGQLWREVSTTGSIKLRPFYGARARRLLPVSAAIGVVIVIASAILLPPLQARPVVGDGIACALYVGNYWFILRGVNYFATHVPPSPFQHFWTLGVEEQFYLLWPPMIIGMAWVIRRRARRRNGSPATVSKRPYLVLLTLITVVSFAVSLVATYVVPAAAYFSLPARAWDLSIGGLLALTVDRWRRLSPRAASITGWTGLALLLLACNQLTSDTRYPGTAALLPMLGTALVLAAGCALPSLGCGRVLAWSPMRTIGRLSYSWYLWHWPFLVLAPAVLGHPLGLTGRLAMVVVSGGVGALTLRFLENPLRYAPPLRRSPLGSIAVGGVATAMAACVGVAVLERIPTPVGHGAPGAPMTITAMVPPAGASIQAYDTIATQLFAQVQAALNASAGLKVVPSHLTPSLADTPAEKSALYFNGCLRTPFQSGQPECVMGDADSATTVALIGDSTSAMMIPAFQQVAEQRHWRLEPMGKGACSVIDSPVSTLLRRLVEHVNHCEQWRTEIVARLHAEHPRLVVVSMWRGYGTSESLSGLRSYDSAWLDGLTRLVRDLRGTGAKVLVLGPVPDPHFVVPLCVSANLDDVTACVLRKATSVNESGIAVESAATAAGGGQYNDLTDLFCTTDLCPVIVGNTLVYMDETHATFEYSRQLAPAMGALADRALARN
ncbi:MAG TPA: acyltransferase family protein [Mycobacterium sp.]|nr:acyltransferase family protein [Mycobacterium sp.]